MKCLREEYYFSDSQQVQQTFKKFLLPVRDRSKCFIYILYYVIIIIIYWIIKTTFRSRGPSPSAQLWATEIPLTSKSKNSLSGSNPHLSKASKKYTLEYQIFCIYTYGRGDRGPKIPEVINYQMPIIPIIKSVTNFRQGYIPVINKV